VEARCDQCLLDVARASADAHVGAACDPAARLLPCFHVIKLGAAPERRVEILEAFRRRAGIPVSITTACAAGSSHGTWRTRIHPPSTGTSISSTEPGDPKLGAGRSASWIISSTRCASGRGDGESLCEKIVGSVHARMLAMKSSSKSRCGIFHFGEVKRAAAASHPVFTSPQEGFMDTPRFWRIFRPWLLARHRGRVFRIFVGWRFNVAIRAWIRPRSYPVLPRPETLVRRTARGARAWLSLHSWQMNGGWTCDPWMIYPFSFPCAPRHSFGPSSSTCAAPRPPAAMGVHAVYPSVYLALDYLITLTPLGSVMSVSARR